MSRFLGTKGHRAVSYSFELPDHSEVVSFAGAYRDKLSFRGVTDAAPKGSADRRAIKPISLKYADVV